MHEVAIAERVLEEVARVLCQVDEPIDRIRVTVQLGSAAGVSAEALRFGFEVASSSSPLPPAELRIEPVPLVLKCTACRAEFQADHPATPCPHCGRACGQAVQGDRVKLAALEYEPRKP